MIMYNIRGIYVVKKLYDNEIRKIIYKKKQKNDYFSNILKKKINTAAKYDVHKNVHYCSLQKNITAAKKYNCHNLSRFPCIFYQVKQEKTYLLVVEITCRCRNQKYF